MPIHSFDQIMRDLKNKVYYPVYLLQGDEPYYIDLISDYIEGHVLTGNESEFNQTVLYGRDTDLLSLVSAAKRYPMMANYQVIIVKEAQDIKNLIPKEIKGKEKKSETEDKNPMLLYLQNPLKSTLLILGYKYKSVDKRTKIGKAFEKSAVIFESKKLKDNLLPDWISRYVNDKGYKISSKAAQLISDYIGSNLSRIVNELDKTIINVNKETEIDLLQVEQNIGISKDFNIFELQQALGNKNILKANRIVNHFAANPKTNPIPMTLANLSSYFNKVMHYHSLQNRSSKAAANALGVNEYYIGEYEKAAKNYSQRKVELIFNHIREYDMRSKGVGSGTIEDGGLLKELVFKILH